MNKRELLEFIEDKNFQTDENWYLHATSTNFENIKKILDEGIKSGYLRNSNGNHFNGKFYISLYKNNNENINLCSWLSDYPKIIINDITPFYADRKKYKLRRIFINTRIPLRTSEWDGEYQQYLKIDPSKFVALEYSLSKLLLNSNDSNAKQKLIFLQDMIIYMEQSNKDLPIYDFSTNREINKEKVLSLHL